MDIHSYARPAEARVTNVALDLRADFDRRRLVGTAALSVDRAPDARSIVLDTRDLIIHRVTDHAGHELAHRLGQVDAIIGCPLEIDLPAAAQQIAIDYETSPQAAALQWLSPEQTAGRRQPFLYSQGQAILTRTWIPTQDSPGVRQTYTARIIVPAPLRAVMSAESRTPAGREVPGGRAFEFRLDQPVPPYLFALAVGDLAFRELGPRTGVYAEPATVDAAAFEFADVEQMVTAAESLLGAYRWGRYDLLVLPPSFPFGGMENPLLTFATPTVLAGDRSLVSLVAHELAHSWSGNLVTNATWSDFWLNEGVTTYVEHRIMEELYGTEHADMLAVLARRDLLEEIDRLGGPQSRDTVLHVDLRGRDPDDGATRIPYDKGAALMTLLEHTVGRDRFDAFLKSYFDRFAFTSIETATFLDFLKTRLLSDSKEADSARLRLHEWVFEPGLPGNAMEPKSARLDRVAAAARSCLDDGARGPDTSTWTTQEWLHFLNTLPEHVSIADLGRLDEMFGFTTRGNSEVLFAWLRIALKHRYLAAMPALERFLTRQGRRKFLRPLFEDLMATDWGRPIAQRIYAQARPGYHAVVTSTLDPIVRGA
ncbi:MAG TPA: M1 family metallopeptidase [Vicinamibacterales bacterium]|nr:M1 family metallopeptidase [Vicinamibacterales bacterium]